MRVDTVISDNKLTRLSIAGNQRGIDYYTAKKGRRLTLKIVRKYLPDYDTWRSYRSDEWREGVTRYRRT